MKIEWPRGLQAEMARAVEVSPQHICDIFARRKRASVPLAAKIEAFAKENALPITRLDVLYPGESTCPLMRG